MGLLPTGTGDWLAFESRGVVSVLVNFAPCGVGLKLIILDRHRNYRYYDT